MTLHQRRKTGVLLPILVIGLFVIGLTSVSAQGILTPLTLGQEQVGQISASSIAPGFVFSNPAPQTIGVVIEARSPGLAPALRVLSGSGELIADVENPGGISSLETVLFLPTAGTYVFQVQSASGVGGQFAITLGQAVPPQMLVPGQPVTDNLTLEQPVDRYLFDSAPNSIVELVMQAQPPANTTAILTGENGELFAEVSLRLPIVRLAVPPNTGRYILTLQYGGVQVETYQLALQGDTQLPGVPVPTATPVVTPTAIAPTPIPLLPLPSTGPCVVASFDGSRVNIRSGPDTSFNVVTQISGNIIADVIGRNAENTWLQVITRNTNVTGWVASFVVRRGGDCSTVPVVSGPSLPTQTPIPPAGLPDLIVSAVSVTPNPPTEDQSFSVNVTVSNIGVVPANNVLVRGTFDPDGNIGINTPVSDANIATILPGTAVTVNFTGIIVVDPGEVDITINADPNNTIAESNEGNNVSQLEIAVSPNKPDLIISDIDVDIDEGSTEVDVSVSVRNIGGATANNFQVSVSFQPPNVGPQNIPWDDISPGDTETKTITVNLGASGDYTVTAVADSGDVVDETNEGNNVASEGFNIPA